MSGPGVGSQIVRAAVFRGLGKPLAIEDITLDPPEATEVLVRMKAVGLCHTDQHYLLGHIPSPMVPIVMGHEGSGVVEAVGPDVRDIQVGDHVALLWRPNCKECDTCKQGHYHRCSLQDKVTKGEQVNGTYRRRDMTGAPVGSSCMTGAFAEMTVVDQTSVVTVDRDLDFEAVALSSCCVTGGHGAVVNATHIKQGDDVLIIGAGAQGCVAVQAARSAGAGRVISADRHRKRLDMASELGATDTVLAENAGELTGKIMVLTGGKGVDHAIACAGSVDALVQAYRSTKAGGSVVLSGIPPLSASNIPLLPIEVLAGNGKTLIGSQYGAISPNVGILRTLEEYKNGKLRIKELIRRTYKLNEVQKGFDDLAAGEAGRGLIRVN